MDWTIPLIILQLIVLEGLLSIDNAAVLGAMVTPLPDDKPIEWQTALRSIGHALNKLLGNQRTAALRVGLLGAYVGRGVMLLLASLIVNNPWLKIIGALYLMHLAFENLGTVDVETEEGEIRRLKTGSFWSVVVSVELADLVFSLDNVVTAVSLSDKLWVVMLGVAIGILMMRFAAGLFSYAVQKEPILKTAAYILILNIGIELLLEEFGIFEFADWQRFAISLITVGLCLAYAHIKPLHKLRPAIVWVGQGFGIFSELINWVVVPVTALVRGLIHLFRLIFAPRKSAQPPAA